MHIVGQCLSDVRARMYKVHVELLHHFGMFGEYGRHEGACLQVAPALQLKHVPSAQITGPAASRFMRPGSLYGLDAGLEVGLGVVFFLAAIQILRKY